MRLTGMFSLLTGLTTKTYPRNTGHHYGWSVRASTATRARNTCAASAFTLLPRKASLGGRNTLERASVSRNATARCRHGSCDGPTDLQFRSSRTPTTWAPAVVHHDGAGHHEIEPFNSTHPSCPPQHSHSGWAPRDHSVRSLRASILLRPSAVGRDGREVRPSSADGRGRWHLGGVLDLRALCVVGSRPDEEAAGPRIRPPRHYVDLPASRGRSCTTDSY